MSVPEYVAILRQRNSLKQPKVSQQRAKYDEDDPDGASRQRPIIRNQRPQGSRRNQDDIDNDISKIRLNQRDPVRRGYQNYEDDLEIEQKVVKKSRKSLPSQRKYMDEDDEVSDFSPINDDSRIRRNPTEFSEVGNDDIDESRHQMPNISDADEISALKSVITDLQAQIKDLEQENRRLQQTNRSLTNEITQLKTTSRQTEQLEQELEDRETTIDELQQVIKSKEASFAALDRDYRTLESDYKRLSDMRSAESENAMAKQMEMMMDINRLQKELDQIRYTNQDDRFKLREPVLDDPVISRFSRNDPQPPLVRRGVDVPSAMKDNLRFGDETLPHQQKPFYDVLVEEMSDQEMRDRLRELSTEREEKERLLNRVPPKGSNMSHVRRQKEELDDEIVEIGKKIGKLKLEMKKRGIY